MKTLLIVVTCAIDNCVSKQGVANEKNMLKDYASGH